jgi:tetratricopeptide (TPR) repeat protein
MVIKLSQKARAQLDSLTARQKELFFASGIFAPDGDFTAEALLTIQRGETLSADEIDAAFGDVAALAPNLLTADAPYFRHTSQNARKYALRELEKSKRDATLQDHHMQYYRMRVHHATPSPDDPLALESDCAQLRHAIQWTAKNAGDELPALVLSAGHYLASERTYRGEVHQWLTLALGHAAALQAGDDLRLLGDLSVHVRHTDAAHEFYQQALHRYGESSLAGQAHTYKGLGDLSVQENDLEAALQYYHRAYILYEVMGFALGQANTLRQLAELRAQVGALNDAYTDYRHALVIYADLGFDFELANCYRAVADLQTIREDYGEAQANYERAFALYGQLGFEDEQAASMLALGDMHLRAKRPEQASQHYTQALSLYQEAGDRLGQAEAHRAAGNLSLSVGDMGAASKAFHQALERYEQINADQEAAVMLHLLASLYLDHGEPQQSVTMIHRALPILKELDDPLSVHEIQTRLRRIVHQIGDDFNNMWKTAAGSQKAPGWLLAGDDSSDIPEVLVAALASGKALHTALASDPLLLDHLSRVPLPRRAEWLENALALCEAQSTEAQVRRHRAMLLKEIAALPGQNVNDRLIDAINEFDVALDLQSGDPGEYATTQMHRVALLRDMAGMSGVNRAELLYRAKGGCDSALEKLTGQPLEYAHMQLIYAHLLREMAGLRGEDRAERMLQALDVYDEALTVIADTPLQHATAQSNRASLLQEIAGLPEEDEQQRLREALAAAADSVVIAAQAEEANYTPIAKRMMANIRQGIIESYDKKTFDAWWQEIVGSPQPEWVLTA